MRRILARCLVATTLMGGALFAPTTSLAHPDGPPGPPDNQSPIDVTTLPTCNVKPWKGFETPEEAAAVPDDAPTCVTPQDMVVTQRTGRHGPTPGPVEPDSDGSPYRWNGISTQDMYKGVEATIQVSNTSVNHDGSFNEFVVSRVMGKSPVSGNWLEAGWAETSWEGDFPYVYTYTPYNNPSGAWKAYFQYHISPSLYYKFRVDRCFVGPTTVHTCAQIYWAGTWQILTSGNHSCTEYSGGTDNERCYMEAFTETYSVDSTPTPSLATGNSLDWDGVKIRKGTTWYNLTTAYPVNVNDSEYPYVVCFQARHYDFSVHRYYTC